MYADHAHARWRPSGFTLVELVVFIVIVSVGVVGLVSVSGHFVRDSADPMLRKQMVAIAESLLNEVTQQPFTYCDPDDTNFFSATQAADCTGGLAGSQENIGPTPGTETRYGAVGTQFDNVADYGGFSKANIDDVAGGNAMAGYTANVAIANAGATFGLSPTAVLQITVTVQRNGLPNFSLAGYRFRYAPRN